MTVEEPKTQPDPLPLEPRPGTPESERTGGIRLLARLWKLFGSRYVTLLLVVLTAALYLGSVSPYWFIGNDSATYRSLGESLAAGHGYLKNGDVHAKAMPGFPLLLAACIRLGLDEVWQLNLVIAVMGLALCWATWALAAQLVGRSAANLCALVLASSDGTQLWSHYILTEIPFTLLMVLAALSATLAWRQAQFKLAWLITAMLFGAAGATMRPNAFVLFIALGIWLWFCVGRAVALWKRIALTAAMLACAVTPFTLWSLRAQELESASYAAETSSRLQSLSARRYFSNLHQSTLRLGRQLADDSMETCLSHYGAGAVRLVFLAAVVAGVVLAFRRRQHLLPVMLAACLVFTAFFLPLERYVFVVYPFALILAACGAAWAVRRWPLPTSVLAAAMVGVLALHAGTAVWRWPRHAAGLEVRSNDYHRFADYYRSINRNAAVFFASDGGPIRYLSGLPATRILETPKATDVRPSFGAKDGQVYVLVIDGDGQRETMVLATARRRAASLGVELRLLAIPGIDKLQIYQLDRRVPRPTPPLPEQAPATAVPGARS